uniref:Uncharacterized protein LOC111105149 n=1 Tax=Crassostrea virginica TaxID=6565 RepID=A0A8B8AV10_CRAVI|nr:uncharacterized protein LOC111105149 [Crassostrea virginica]
MAVNIPPFHPTSAGVTLLSYTSTTASEVTNVCTNHEEGEHLPTLCQEDLPAVRASPGPGERPTGGHCGGGQVGHHQHHHCGALRRAQVPRPHRRPPLHPDGTRKRTTTHLMWYRGCGIDESKRKDMHVPKNIPNLVDMTGLENVESREQEKLLEMILMGRIPDETSIPALQDMERTNPGSLDRKFPFIYDPRRIHKILFIASATEPIPTKLIKSVRNVAQPDGSPSNVNPRYIPLFGLMTKEDLVNFEDKEIQDREREFLQSLGIDQTASYSRWQNNPTGDFSCRVLYFLDRLLSPEVRVVLDQIIFFKRWIGSAWENPSYALLTLPLSALGFIAIFWASVYLNLYF